MTQEKIDANAKVVLSIGGKNREMSYGAFARELMEATSSANRQLLHEQLSSGAKVPVKLVDPMRPEGVLWLAQEAPYAEQASDRKMANIAVEEAGKLVESAFKAACGSTLLLEAVKGEWQRTTRGMTEVSFIASGDLAIGSLKSAMDKVQTRTDQRANLIGMFCNEWNLLTAPAAHRATEQPMQGSRVARSMRP